MTTWTEAKEPQLDAITPMGWLRVLFRSAILIVLVFGCLLILLIVRLIERPIWGLGRPI